MRIIVLSISGKWDWELMSYPFVNLLQMERVKTMLILGECMLFGMSDEKWSRINVSVHLSRQLPTTE